jgi:c(7)-type cytochrome triheme protein
MVGQRPKHLHRRSRVVLLAVLLVISSCMFVWSAAGDPEIPDVPPSVSSEAPAQDFSRFRHNTQQHTRMPCLVCHIRSETSTTPKMPGHIPCSSCHVQEFAAGNQHPICTICHTATDVKRFPPLRSFNAVFDHGRHARQTNCATCHKPTRRGVALSIPARVSAHTTCFQCHGPRTMVAGKNIGSCSTCHRPGRLVRTPETARAYSVNFSHAEHARKGLSCSQCHTVRAGMRRGAQVTSPVAAMHFARARVRSCAACHNDRRAFGGNDFSDCKRCHEGSSFKF